MRQWILVLVMLWGNLPVISAQDFATRFLDEHRADSSLTCVTISPKMMEEILRIDLGEDDMMQIISELKSMQIIRSEKDGSQYFSQAQELMNKNSDRFETFLSASHPTGECMVAIYKKRDEIIELVMLMSDNEQFLVINFTGKMSEDFITKLTAILQPKEISLKT